MKLTGSIFMSSNNLYQFIYIYIQRERERERERKKKSKGYKNLPEDEKPKLKQSTEKNVIKLEKTPYYNYKKLFSFRKLQLFLKVMMKNLLKLNIRMLFCRRNLEAINLGKIILNLLQNADLIEKIYIKRIKTIYKNG